MLSQVESKIQELNERKNQEYKDRKKAYLEEFEFVSAGKNKPAPVITDEEYEELLRASFGTKNAGMNKTAKLMKVCSGLVLALGIVAAIATAAFAESLGFVYFSVIVFAAILISFLFKGIGESIRLQQQLVDMKLLESKKSSKTVTDEKRSFPDTQPSVDQQFANAPPVQQAYSTYIVSQ
ncbi:MAG: hypothetical protein ACI4XE_08850 [Acutalibacteraceae bacterium]